MVISLPTLLLSFPGALHFGSYSPIDDPNHEISLRHIARLFLLAHKINHG